ncbi:MAG: 4a-hydroxytetrahydrobiopterin dehydratase [Burkholderiaceae bacterium]|nr:4a-hydroxytetrahydrobiopterin dehydratase [Burkholderiaceae bacterium]
MISPSHSKTSPEHARRALTAIEIEAHLAQAPGWSLNQEGPAWAIEKTYAFANYYETMAFVNALAFIAHAHNHHPDLSVHYQRCGVRLSTHDVGGLSAADFDCASRYDALLA